MKVALEAQHACTAKPRGIPYYVIQLIRHLLIRQENDYNITFFDCNSERNNRFWIDKYFGEYNASICECNSLNYGVASKFDEPYVEKSYNDYTGTCSDIYHFMHVYTVPSNLKGKMVVTIHDLLPIRMPECYSPESRRIFQIGLSRLLKMNPTIITDSIATKNDILSFTGLPMQNIHVVPLAYDDVACFPEKNTFELQKMRIDASYILYLGAIDLRKNILRILDAFDAVAQRYPDIKLVLAGGLDANATEITSKLENYHYIDRVILTGYVTDEQKRILLSGAVAFLFPSLFEGFGLPILEAMACGCPVITSNISSMPEVAGDAAILIDPYDTEQLKEAMEQIIKSDSLQQVLRQKGFLQLKNFSWDKTAEMTEAVYRAVMGT